MLAAALRGHRRNGPFHDLEECLLHALARDVAGDRRIVGFAADLIDLVDIDDAALRPLDIVVGVLQKLQNDVLDVLADITCFGQGGGVRHRERNVEDTRQSLSEERLAAAGGTHQQDVRFRQLDFARFACVIDPFVMIVDGDGQYLLGVALADHRIVEHLEDFGRRRHALARLHERGLVFLVHNFRAQFDAFIADEHGRARNQLADLVLALSAEGAIEGVLGFRSTRLGHSYSCRQFETFRPRLAKTAPERPAREQPLDSLYDHDKSAFPRRPMINANASILPGYAEAKGRRLWRFRGWTWHRTTTPGRSVLREAHISYVDEKACGTWLVIRTRFVLPAFSPNSGLHPPAYG